MCRMKRFPILIILFLLVELKQGYSQTDTLFLWSRKVPGQENPFLLDKGDNVIRVPQVTSPCPIVYAKQLGKGVIISSSGNYNHLAINKTGSEISQWFNSTGYTAFISNYRIPQKQEDALQDIQRANEIVKESANHHKIDSKSVELFGSSAGGNPSVQVSIGYLEQTYEPIELLDTHFIIPAFVMLHLPTYLDHGEEQAFTPETKIDCFTCPMFQFASADDYYGNSLLVMTAVLKENKVPEDLHTHPTSGHKYCHKKWNHTAETLG